MNVVERLLTGHDKRKVKVFSLFLVCSFLAWSISNLSESYESRVNFALTYRNVPDTLLLGKNTVNTLEAKIRTSGFRLLYFNFVKKRMDIDLAKTIYEKGRYFISEEDMKKQLERQFSQSVSLLDLDGNGLLVDLYQAMSKKLVVIPKVDIQFRPNHILEGKFIATPDSIEVKGLKNEIEPLDHVETEHLVLNDVSSDFSQNALLVFPNEQENSIFFENKVTVSGKVVRFSEKVLQVPVKAINFPEGYRVKLFPDIISLICKASVEDLQDISPEDFVIIADYKQLEDQADSQLPLQVAKKPRTIYGVRLQEGEVNFILEKE